MTEEQKALLKTRFDQARDEIDDCTFSPDQVAKLHNAFTLIQWALEEAIACTDPGDRLAALRQKHL